MTDAASLTVATYNVHRCIGSDGRHDPARVAEVVRELDADVLGLQEVAVRSAGPGAVDQLDHLARAAGLEAVGGPTAVHGPSTCGNGLLTRLPIVSVAHRDLSVPGREPRAALDVVLAAGARRLRAIVTHLGLLRRDRRVQAARLIDVLGGQDAELVVVLGDVNEWLPRLGCVGRLDARLGRSSTVRTFPASRPLFALDRIWVHPCDVLSGVRAHATPLARVASDHLPVRGTVRFGVG
jgi:endonuclease/exonuclease/phosphatase family metal-dependent hydrolase